MRETTHLVTVRGCIRGNRLKIDRESLKDALAVSVLNVKDFALKEQTLRLRAHELRHISDRCTVPS